GSRTPPPPSQFRPELDSELEALLMKALAGRPALRFESMQEFIGALAGYAGRGAGRPAAGAGSLTGPFAKTSNPGAAPADPRTRRCGQAERYHLERRTEEPHRKSIAGYVQILDDDPTCAPAWAGLAFAYHLLSVRGSASPPTACPKAKGAALRALALDDS